MGVAVGDYNLDGNLDIFKTHFADDTNVLYRNDGKGNFDDVTIRAGIGVETRYVGWGAGMADLDNDGFPDIFIVTGSVYPEVERNLPAYPFRTPRLVFRNLGDGRFEELIEEAGSGVAATHTSRGCAFGDFDNDGDVDILVMNMNEPPSLLRNDVSGTGHWLKVLLVGVTSNRSAIGARVAARYGDRKQTQAVCAQSSFYSANDRRLHFGLGDAGRANSTIRWPSGVTERIPNVKPITSWSYARAPASSGVSASLAHGPLRRIVAPWIIDNIPKLLPDTQTVVVVIGALRLEQFWLKDVKRAFKRFEGRLTFVCTNGWSLTDLLQRCARHRINS